MEPEHSRSLDSLLGETRADIRHLQTEMTELRGDIRHLQTDVVELRQDFRRLDNRVFQLALVQLATLATALGSLVTALVSVLAA